jgi:hypothetical protein
MLNKLSIHSSEADRPSVLCTHGMQMCWQDSTSHTNVNQPTFKVNEMHPSYPLIIPTTQSL